ncbi:hypothetical protein Sango_0822500 [Sesamum angolense]|uniref:SWIM-type domain-containing protein n=1 Tax=Sesamum angolense TaxID=2727404 RepID=A0AAE2C0G8_9LAMI|nr:hypothetical protein Sango_0822500 [Sesamum angolense]
MPIKKDRDLQYFFNPMTGYVSIDIFVQAEKIREMVVPDDPAVSEWGTYMSMLTQELSSVPVVTQSMGRFGINDNYPGPSSYASPSDYAGPSSFAGPSDYAGTSSPAGPSVSSEQDDEPEADSMLNNEHVDSEPDEVEVEGLTTNNPENNDEVSIEVMIDVLGNTASGPRSQRQDHFDLNMPVSCEPTNLYSVIPFFEAMHPEDFSVRFARREYRVVESKPKLWKVACKYDEQTGCSWMLRGIFQPNMGLFKITKYAGPHTCLMNEILLSMKLNPGTVVEWLNLDTDRSGVQMLHYVFWAFRSCIEGFRSCRNVISVDGTHLYTKYKHKLLVVVTLDANQQVLPLASALVDEESLASWRWFLQMLAKHLLPNDDDRVCLILDRHSGLISAINYVPAFKFPRGVHRFCLRHVCSNFNKKFNNIRLKDLCWRAGAEVNARKFERIMTEIRELNEEAYNWLEMINKTQWTLSHDSGWRTGILTTNMSECVNGVLKGARRLPIVAIVQITFHRIFEARQAEAVHHIVQKFDYNQQSASVLTLSLTGQGSHTYVVKLKHKTCSCGKWGTHGIPCSHAIQVSRHFGVNASNFIPQYYSIRAYRKTYQGRFEPLYGKSIGIPLTLNLCIIRRSEFAEDQADIFRRGYQMKWIDHKHVLANNINLVKFRINVITL